MNLRDYQAKAVDGVFEAWKDHASTLVVLPTGCGKTVVFAEVIRRLGGKRAIVLAHREELVFQARDKIASFAGIDADIEMAEMRAGDFFGHSAPVVVSTIQTQGSGARGGERMLRFDPREFSAVIVDEAHHATSPSYRRVIDHYLGGNPECRLLGVTATPDRLDAAALGMVFESVAYSYEISQAIAEGWLVPVNQQMVTVSSLDFSHIRTNAGDLDRKQLAELLEEEENLHRIAAPTLEICREKRTLVFTASVKQAERLSEILNRGMSGSSEWLCGETSKEERRAILERFRRGETRFLVNVGVLTEGFDDAGVEAVVMARPTKSRALYAQMIGRGTRPAAEIAGALGGVGAAERLKMIASSAKPGCLVVDFAGNAGRHKLVSAADILGGKYEDEVVEEAKRRIRERGMRRGEEDVSAELERVKRELDERRRQEEAKRRQVRATAFYTATAIDPFDRYDLVRYAKCDDAMYEPIPFRDSEHLRKAFGKSRFDRFNLAQKNALLDEMRRRQRVGEFSFRQEKFLAKRGIRIPMRKDEASRVIDRIRKEEGWAA